MTDRILNCTPDNPMPRDRDQMGQHWYHHGARPMPGVGTFGKLGDTQMWECPNCGEKFTVKLNKAVTVAQAQQKLADMRAKGYREP